MKIIHVMDGAIHIEATEAEAHQETRRRLDRRSQKPNIGIAFGDRVLYALYQFNAMVRERPFRRPGDVHGKTVFVPLAIQDL